jgi:hypothetical protein
MSLGLLIGVGAGTLFGLLIVGLIYRRIPKRLKVDKFICDWKELQAYCRDKSTWPNAIQEADKLLDTALKKRKYKGKSMGERMVSAQRIITNNDQLWFAHNLAKKVIADPKLKLREADVKAALIGFRQALKDLGALQSNDVATQSADAKDTK